MKVLGEGLYAIAMTLWVGGSCVVGFIVAPVLFHMLADRSLAGSIAGRLFTLMAYLGLGCAVYMLIFRLARFGGACFKSGIFWLILLMLALTAVEQFGVQPIIAGLRDQALPKEVMESVFRSRFIAWHGVASVLYLILSLLGGWLVWLQGRDPR